MPIEKVPLSQRLIDQLEREAERRGLTPAELAAELMRKDLAERTKPRNSRGPVTAFRRKA